MADSSLTPAARKAAKAPQKFRKRQATRPLPHPDFPLFHHGSGRWAKKFKGKLLYFGKVAGDENGQTALAEWLRQKDDLLAGRKPRSKDSGGVTIKYLCNRFLAAKQQQVDAGEIKQLSWNDYKATCERLLTQFGESRLVTDLQSDDFEELKASIAAGKKRKDGTQTPCGLVATGNEITRVRVVFKYAFDADLVDKPVRYGPMFKRSTKKVLRRAGAAGEEKMIEAADLRRIIEISKPQMKAMILLALNGGLGNSDVGHLPLSALDLESGWCNYPRPKTGVQRRFPLWPETVKAIKTALTKRPQPKTAEAEPLVFVTRCGASWANDEKYDNPVTKGFRKLLETLGLHRSRIGFYTLRHTHRSISDDAGDQPAANYIMGHSDGSMSEVYRHRINDDRLEKVCAHVRKWLFAKPGKKKGGSKQAQQKNSKDFSEGNLRIVG